MHLHSFWPHLKESLVRTTPRPRHALAMLISGYVICGIALTCLIHLASQALNNLDQSPCEVAQILLGACSADGAFTASVSTVSTNLALVEPLFDSVSSAGPTEGQENDCSCSTVVYSLVSQCLLCQNDNITTYVLTRDFRVPAERPVDGRRGHQIARGCS